MKLHTMEPGVLHVMADMIDKWQHITSEDELVYTIKEFGVNFILFRTQTSMHTIVRGMSIQIVSQVERKAAEAINILNLINKEVKARRNDYTTPMCEWLYEFQNRLADIIPKAKILMTIQASVLNATTPEKWGDEQYRHACSDMDLLIHLLGLIITETDKNNTENALDELKSFAVM